MLNLEPLHQSKKLLLSLITLMLLTLLFISSAANAAEKSATAMDELIQAANRAGVQVIVLNPNQPASEPQQTIVLDQRSGLAKLRADADQFRNKAQAFMLLLPEARKEMLAILRSSSPDGSIFFYLKMVLYSLLFFAAGYVFTREIYGKRMVGPWFIAKQITNPVGYSEKLPILVTRFLLGVGGILLIMLVAYIIDSIINGKARTETEMLSIGYIYFGFAMINLVSLLWRMILSPYLADYRIPKFHPDNLVICTIAAKKLYLWLWIGATMGISFNLLVSWLGELGVSSTIYGVMNLYLTGITAL